MPRGRSAEEMRQVTRDRVAKQRQRAAAATSAPTPASLSPRATAHKEEGHPELVRPQAQTVVKPPLLDEPVEVSELAPAEDLSQYAPRTVEVGIYGPVGPSRPVIVYACNDLAAQQLRWVNDQGEILLEQPAAQGGPSMQPKPSDLVSSASRYGGFGAYRPPDPFYRSRFERLMNEGA